MAFAKVVQHLNSQKSYLVNACRTLVSSSYNCESSWKGRLKSKTLSGINTADQFRKIKHALDTGAFVSAIDMDIVSNKLHEIEPLSFELLEDIFYKFRHTNESVNMLESTPHAFFRTLMEHEEHSRLLSLLEDKINFGFFLDSHIANMLLDYFIEQKSYLDAIRIVSDLMLQEEFDDPITRSLSYYACHLYIMNTPDLRIESPLPIPNDLEKVYRKVSFIENPWYDDHFDLHNDQLKLGKSLTMLSSCDDAVSRGYLLVGYILYHKFEKALSLLENWIENEKAFVLSDTILSLVESLLDNMGTTKIEVPSEPGLVRLAHLVPHVTEEEKESYISKFKLMKEKLIKEQKVMKDLNVDEYMMNLVKKTLEEHQEEFIKKQMQVYERWNNERDTLLDEQVKMWSIKQKKEDLTNRLLDLKTKEEKLKYFEEKTRIELYVSEQPEYPKIKEVVLEEQFVAPPGERKSAETGKKKSK